MKRQPNAILIACCMLPGYVNAKVYWHSSTKHVVIIPDAPDPGDEGKVHAYNTVVERLKFYDIGSGYRADDVPGALKVLVKQCGGSHNIQPIVGESA